MPQQVLDQVQKQLPGRVKGEAAAVLGLGRLHWGHRVMGYGTYD